MHALCRADGAGLADSGLGLGTSSRPAEHPGICKRPEAPGRTGVLDSRYSRFSVPGVSSLPHLALASVESWKCLGARRREREGERASWARRPRVGGGGPRSARHAAPPFITGALHQQGVQEPGMDSMGHVKSMQPGTPSELGPYLVVAWSLCSSVPVVPGALLRLAQAPKR